MASYEALPSLVHIPRLLLSCIPMLA